MHGTTGTEVLRRFDEDQFAMQMVNGRPDYPYVDDELRKVARDAYVAWRGSRYSVPWEYAGKEVWVRECGPQVEVRWSNNGHWLRTRAWREVRNDHPRKIANHTRRP